MTTSLQQQLPLLHQQPLPCRSSYHSSTGNHLPAPAATSSAPAATSPAPVTTFVHQRSPSCTSRYQQLSVLHQQLPVLNQRPLSCTRRHQQLPVLKQDHFPAPADTSNYQFCTSTYQSWTSDHLPAPVDISPKPTTIFLHQQKPVLYQRPPIQWIPVLYQLSNLLQWLDPAPMITIRPRQLFAVRFSNSWFTIIKFGLLKQLACFVILA